MRKIFIIFILIFTFFGVESYATVSGDIKKGNSLYREEKYDEAVEKYRSALDKAPASDIVNYDAGAAYYKKKAYKDAEGYFTKALATDDPGLEGKANYNIGNAKYRQGEPLERSDVSGAIKLYEEALDHYKRAIDIDGKDEDAKFNYEFVKEKLNKLKQQSQQNKQDKKQENQQNKQDQKNQGQNKQDDQSGQSGQSGKNDQDKDKQEDSQNQQDQNTENKDENRSPENQKSDENQNKEDQKDQSENPKENKDKKDDQQNESGGQGEENKNEDQKQNRDPSGGDSCGKGEEQDDRDGNTGSEGGSGELNEDQVDMILEGFKHEEQAKAQEDKNGFLAKDRDVEKDW